MPSIGDKIVNLKKEREKKKTKKKKKERKHLTYSNIGYLEK